MGTMKTSGSTSLPLNRFAAANSLSFGVAVYVKWNGKSPHPTSVNNTAHWKIAGSKYGSLARGGHVVMVIKNVLTNTLDCYYASIASVSKSKLPGRAVVNIQGHWTPSSRATSKTAITGWKMFTGSLNPVRYF